MTTTHVCRISASEGQTATAKRFVGVGSSDTVLATAVSVIEQTNDKGAYLCTFEDQDAGYAKIKLFSVASGRALSEGFCAFSGVDGEVLECGVGAAVLDSATQAQIDAIEASTAGTVSGAGTGTEIFVGTNVTLTITVDADGNRSSVVVS